NRIFAHRVLSDGRCRHRRRLLARQIGGSGNAQRGNERSRYDYDDLHDANPLVLATRTGRPGDAPIPLCLCETPASNHPTFRLNRRGMAPDYLSPRPSNGSNVIGRIWTVVIRYRRMPDGKIISPGVIRAATRATRLSRS